MQHTEIANLRRAAHCFNPEECHVANHPHHSNRYSKLGLCKDVAKNIQLDATVGRADNDTMLSLGMKFMF